MRFAFWASAGNPWDEILRVARLAESTGWDGVWVPDHFMPLAEGYGDEPDADAEPELAPVHEAWTLLAGLAASVPRVRLGALVSGNTYRHPALLANMAATVDHISGGRLVVGLGAAWQENEHRRYGLHYGTAGERLDRLDEACQVLRGLFDNERFDFEGQYYALDGAPMAPKPIQPRLPLMIGGGGERRTLLIAARYADEWNAWGTPELMHHKNGVLDEHCETVGRDPSEIARSAAALLFYGVEPPAVDRPTVGGSVEQMRERVGQYVEAGVDELILPDFTMRPEDKAEIIEGFVTEVAEGFRSAP